MSTCYMLVFTLMVERFMDFSTWVRKMSAETLDISSCSNCTVWTTTVKDYAEYVKKGLLEILLLIIDLQYLT